VELTDLMPLEEWKAFEVEVAEKYKVNANVFDKAGIRITDYKYRANSLCPEIKATDKGQSFICAVAHMNIAAQAVATHAPLIEECDGGFIKMVVPIFVKGEFVGSFSTCGFLMEGGEIDSFIVNKITEIDEERIKILSKDIVSLSTAKVEEIKNYMAAQIDKIVTDFKEHT